MTLIDESGLPVALQSATKPVVLGQCRGAVHIHLRDRKLGTQAVEDPSSAAVPFQSLVVATQTMVNAPRVRIQLGGIQKLSMPYQHSSGLTRLLQGLVIPTEKH